MKSSRNSQCPDGWRSCETGTGASNASARISPLSVMDFTLPTAVSVQKFGPTLERRSEFFGRMSDSLAEVFGQPSMEIIYIRSAGQIRRFELNLVQGLPRPSDEGCCRARHRIWIAMTKLCAHHTPLFISDDCEFSNHQKVPIAML